VQLNDSARTYFQRVATQQQDPELRPPKIRLSLADNPAPK
jgi:hypothetical protein